MKTVFLTFNFMDKSVNQQQVRISEQMITCIKKSNKTGQGWIKDGTVGSIGGADDEVPKEEVAILKCLPSCCGICFERGH